MFLLMLFIKKIENGLIIYEIIIKKIENGLIIYEIIKIIMSYCKVKNCRFDGSHVTMGHKCGTCGSYGHGQCECEDDIATYALQQYSGDVLPAHLSCKMRGCRYKTMHVSGSHQCGSCNGFGHGQYECKNDDSSDSDDSIKYTIKCPICRKVNNIMEGQPNIYGSNEECKVCLAEKVQLFMPQCGHLCLCDACGKILNTN